jgi:hypothetical protein
MSHNKLRAETNAPNRSKCLNYHAQQNGSLRKRD